MMAKSALCSSLLLLIAMSGCAAGPNARTGSVAGGLTGGAIGALAGADSHRSLEGAAIGALAGATLGGVLGDQVDQDIAHVNAEQQAYVDATRRNAVTLDQVIQMTVSGLGDELIANQIKTKGVIAPLSTSDLIMLKNNGVSDRVIAAWQETPPAASVRPPRYAPPPVVERVHVVEPYWPPQCWSPPPRHYHGRRAGLYMRF